MTSFLTMLGPSPDWNVGLSAEDLCTKECGWVQKVVQDLIPWDAGTDSGVTYEVINIILILTVLFFYMRFVRALGHLSDLLTVIASLILCHIRRGGATRGNCYSSSAFVSPRTTPSLLTVDPQTHLSHTLDTG